MISVLTITHNRQELLKQAINSVLNQSFGDFEYIIVDDGSDDGTDELVKNYPDKRLRYFHYPRIGQLSVLRNLAIEKSSRPILAFLDSDDFWEPNYLETLFASMNSGLYKTWICNAEIFSENNSELVYDKPDLIVWKGDLLKEKLLNDCFVVYPSCFAFLKSSGLRFNEAMKYGDNDLILKALASGNGFICKEPLVKIRKHEENMSSGNSYNSLFIQAYFEELETLTYLKNSQRISSYLFRKAFAKYNYKLGSNLQKIGKTREALQRLLKGFFAYPVHLRSLFKSFLFLAERKQQG